MDFVDHLPQELDRNVNFWGRDFDKLLDNLRT